MIGLEIGHSDCDRQNAFSAHEPRNRLQMPTAVIGDQSQCLVPFRQDLRLAAGGEHLDSQSKGLAKQGPDIVPTPFGETKGLWR